LIGREKDLLKSLQLVNEAKSAKATVSLIGLVLCPLTTYADAGAALVNL